MGFLQQNRGRLKVLGARPMSDGCLLSASNAAKEHGPRPSSGAPNTVDSDWKSLRCDICINHIYTPALRLNPSRSLWFENSVMECIDVDA